MKRPRFAPLAVQAKLEAVTTLLDGGWLELYGGTQPPDATSPPTTKPLARLRFSDPAFAPPQEGVSEAHPLEPEPAAPRAGLAQWFRCRTQDDHPVLDGSVDLADADLIVSSRRILVGTRVTIEQFSLRDGSHDER